VSVNFSLSKYQVENWGLREMLLLLYLTATFLYPGGNLCSTGIIISIFIVDILVEVKQPCRTTEKISTSVSFEYCNISDINKE
jgi:hypothetical protein